MTTPKTPKPSGKLYIFEAHKLEGSSTLDEKLGRCGRCHARLDDRLMCPEHERDAKALKTATRR
jgi:hypothetical protein